MGLQSKFEGMSLAARTAVVAGSLLLGFSVIVSGVALAAVSATQAVFPQDSAPSSGTAQEVDGEAPTPSPVAAGSATKASAQKSKRNATPGRGTFTPGKTAKDGESVE